MKKTLTGTDVVLLYHRIGRPKLSSLVAGQYVAPWLLKSELNYLAANNWSGVSLADILDRGKASPEKNRFAITFDDAYLSAYEHACPALIDRNMSATIYVVSGAIGGINEWDSRAGDQCESIMNAAQIRELSDAGFEIGSHTITHAHLTDISDEQLQQEVTDSKNAIEDIIGKEVVSFSYPYGNFDERIVAAVKAAGYQNAVSAKLGVAGLSDIFEIPRVNVRWNAFGPLLMRKINRARKASGITH
ncbi:MAG: polysaccharide deacetylase family protein [Armatimonadetes bacterium]|nr:polysaccharide deacetylase family protein [Armatimonadota bacterium]